VTGVLKGKHTEETIEEWIGRITTAGHLWFDNNVILLDCCWFYFGNQKKIVKYSTF
jgi:hypothetical protein